MANAVTYAQSTSGQKWVHRVTAAATKQKPCGVEARRNEAISRIIGPFLSKSSLRGGT